MSFVFSGIFARGDRAVLDALGNEFGGVGKVVNDPFKGIALSQLPSELHSPNAAIPPPKHSPGE